MERMMANQLRKAILVPSVNNYNLIPKPRKEREIPPEEAIKMFGRVESVKMNFIPQMLIHLALEHSDKLIDYCRDNRLGEYKKLTRALRMCVDEYRAGMKQFYGSMAYEAHQAFCRIFREYIEADAVKMWFAIGNVANRQMPENPHRDIAVHVAIIHELINRADLIDTINDKVISEKIGDAAHHRQNKMLRLIVALCFAFEDDFKMKLEPDPVFDLQWKVFANRASHVAETLVETEYEYVPKC